MAEALTALEPVFARLGVPAGRSAARRELKRDFESRHPIDVIGSTIAKNKVRRAVREGVLDPHAGWTRTVGFLNASRPHGAVAITQRQSTFGL